MKKRIPKEYLGAFKEGHRAATKEFIDDDFCYELLRRIKLGDEESRIALEFYAKFNNEHYKVVFKKDGTDLDGSKENISLRNQSRYQRSCDVQRGAHPISDVNGIPTRSGEGALIALIDLKREKEKSNKQ